MQVSYFTTYLPTSSDALRHTRPCPVCMPQVTCWTFLVVFLLTVARQTGIILIIMLLQSFSGTILSFCVAYIVKFLIMEVRRQA